MQKLFENWRRYKKSIIKEYGRTGAAHLRHKQMSDKMARDDFEKVRIAASMVDPTGILSYPDVADAWANVERDPTYTNSGTFVLELAGAIPIIGKFPKWGRAGLKLLGLIDDAKDTLKTVGGGVEVAQEIGKRVDDGKEALKIISKKSKWGEGIHFTDKAKQLERAPDGTLISRLEIAEILDIDLNKIKKKGWDIYPPGPGSKEVWIVDGWAIHHAVHDAVKAYGYRVEDLFELIDKLKKTQKNI